MAVKKRGLAPARKVGRQHGRGTARKGGTIQEAAQGARADYRKMRQGKPGPNRVKVAVKTARKTYRKKTR